MEPARELRVLEFTKIREMLSAFCVTPMGAELCQSLTPYRDFSEVSRALEETEEATILLAYLGGSPLQWFGDVREQLSLAGKGAALSTKALLDVAGCLRAARAEVERAYQRLAGAMIWEQQHSGESDYTLAARSGQARGTVRKALGL